MRLELDLSPSALATLHAWVARLRTNARVMGLAAVESGNIVNLGIADDCGHAAAALDAFLTFFERVGVPEEGEAD